MLGAQLLRGKGLQETQEKRGKPLPGKRQEAAALQVLAP